MIVVYILLGLLGLLALLLAVPMYARVTYDGTLHARVRVWGVPFTLLPAEDKPKKPTKPKKTAKAGEKQAKKQPTPSKWQELVGYFKEDGPAATVHYLCETAKLAGQAVGKVLGAVTVDRLHLELLVATDDAATTAVRYGQICAVLYPALAAIETRTKVRRRQLRVEPNFLLEKTDARFDIQLHLRVWQAAWAALVLLIKFMLMKDTAPAVSTKEDTTHVQ